MTVMNKGKRFGQLAMEKSFVTLDQIIEALAVQTWESVGIKRCRTIGEILLHLGHIDNRQVEIVLQEKFEPRFGDIAISKGFVTVEQIIEGMSEQVKEETTTGVRRLLGEILMDLGFMTAESVEYVLREMNRSYRYGAASY
ncbi:MAG: hypothetical protein AB1512_15005 [Thermodesulfobacteriota bacterium]